MLPVRASKFFFTSGVGEQAQPGKNLVRDGTFRSCMQHTLRHIHQYPLQRRMPTYSTFYSEEGNQRAQALAKAAWQARVKAEEEARAKAASIKAAQETTTKVVVCVILAVLIVLGAVLIGPAHRGTIVTPPRSPAAAAAGAGKPALAAGTGKPALAAGAGKPALAAGAGKPAALAGGAGKPAALAAGADDEEDDIDAYLGSLQFVQDENALSS
jgi:hypothetical protein